MCGLHVAVQSGNALKIVVTFAEADTVQLYFHVLLYNVTVCLVRAAAHGNKGLKFVN
jgi:uncharacterized membrane protein YoaK (UPF0700 family)